MVKFSIQPIEAIEEGPTLFAALICQIALIGSHTYTTFASACIKESHFPESFIIGRTTATENPFAHNSIEFFRVNGVLLIQQGNP